VGGPLRRWLLPVWGLALFAVACVSGPAPKDHFYRVDVAPPEKPIATPRLAGTLVVNRLRADALTNERQILYRENAEASEVGRLGYHRWVDSPTVMLQGQIADYLRAAGVAPLVVTTAVRVTPDFLLSGRLLRFEWVRGRSAHVSVNLEISITRVDGNQLVHFATYRSQQAAGGNNVGEAVSAFDRALAEIFARLVAEMPASGATRS
jgi:ABC-type uncharacterized transport system auxiliary subunit